MPQSDFVHLIDRRPARRADIARRLGEHGLHVEPYDSFTELDRVRPLPDGSRGSVYPQQGALLVSDDEDIVIRHVIDELRNHLCYLPLLAYSDHIPRTRHVVDAMRSGAWDYFVLPDDYDRIASSVDEVVHKADLIAQETRRVDTARKLIGLLSPREFSVLEKSAEGGTNKSIARDLDLSPRTVEVHRHNLMVKLSASNIVEAAAVFLASRMPIRSNEEASGSSDDARNSN